MLKKIFRIILNGGAYLRIIFYYPINKIMFNEWHLSCHLHRTLLCSKKYIKCGMNVHIGKFARIEAVTRYNQVFFKPLIVFKSGVTIQQGVHITCADSIIIEENTAIAAYVTITDIDHPYKDVSKPIEHQDILVKSVRVGRDCKIYNGSVILPGVHIGNHVTIGANSVVTKDIPDYCVAVGAPAYVIKRYNPLTELWEKTDKQGNFILGE